MMQTFQSVTLAFLTRTVNLSVSTREAYIVTSRRLIRSTPFKMYDTLGKNNLVSIDDCLKAIEQKSEAKRSDLVFVDASWYHTGDRNSRSDFEQGPRIKGAKFVDMKDISTTKELFPELNPKGLPTMLPTKELFAAAMDEFNIKNDDHVIIYGKEGSIFIPRTWFLFRAMGHDQDKVHVMQGSFEEWVAVGGPTEEQPVKVAGAEEILSKNRSPSYVARSPTTVVDLKEMLKAYENPEVTIIDPRGSSFAKGHIPGSVHIPYSNLVQDDNQLKLKPKEELWSIFERAGVDPLTDKMLVTSCGSGVSVCHVLLALEECGRGPEKPTMMYDGSWAEWGNEPETPKASTEI
mmetsp:Transcript_22358/g.38044  ORF Transcript_22358/g.38044 Transcript_22358/m.38044 type:complete len:348 (-) Transcript_22358:788-1831(-)